MITVKLDHLPELSDEVKEAFNNSFAYWEEETPKYGGGLCDMLDAVIYDLTRDYSYNTMAILANYSIVYVDNLLIGNVSQLLSTDVRHLVSLDRW